MELENMYEFRYKNSDLRAICQEKFETMYPSSYGSGKKCMEYINMAYEECFKLAMHEEKSRTIRDWFHEKFPIFSFFRRTDLDGDKHSLTVNSCRRMFPNIVMDYMDIIKVFDDRNREPDNRLVWILTAIGVFVVAVVGTLMIRWMTNSNPTSAKDRGLLNYLKFPLCRKNEVDASNLLEIAPDAPIAIENYEKPPPPLLQEDKPYVLRVTRNSTLYDMILAKVRRGLRNNWSQTCHDEKTRAVYKLITSSSYIEIDLQKPKYSEMHKRTMSVCEMQIIPMNSARPANTPSVSRRSPKTNNKSIYSITNSRTTTSSPNPRTAIQMRKAASPPASPPASPRGTASRYLQPRRAFSRISNTDISQQSQHKYLMKNKFST